MGISELTALELGKEIKEKQISVREAVQASLERIHKYEDTVHAYVTLTEEAALAQADEIQKQIDDGTLTGPLAGVPMAIKDNICTEGIETTCSSKILRGFVPPYSAEAALNLKKAGAILLGKTNMDEFAMGSTTETSWFGPTKNPWSTGRILRWLVCGCRSGRDLFCSWFRYGRFHPPAKFLLRRDRHQTDLWNGFPVWSDRLWFLAGSDWTDCERYRRLRGNSGDDRFL